MSDINKSTEITVPQSSPLVPNKEERQFFESRQDLAFLPTLKLLHGTSPELQKGFKAGEFFLSVLERALHERVLVCICGRRAHALLVENQKKVKESFNYSSPIFKEIMNTPTRTDQTVRSMWSMCDFLCWLPEEAVFCTFFPGVKTLRPIAFDILDHITPPAERTIDSKKELIHTNCFEFVPLMQAFGPVKRSFVVKLKPLTPDASYFPDKEALEATQKIFYAPVLQENRVEVAETDSNR